MRVFRVLLFATIPFIAACAVWGGETYFGAAVGAAYTELDEIQCQGKYGSGFFGGTPVYWEGINLEKFPAFTYCLKLGRTARFIGWEAELFGGIFNTGAKTWSADIDISDDPLLPYGAFDGQLRVRFVVPLSLNIRVVLRIPWQAFQPYVGFGPTPFMPVYCRDATVYDAAGQELNTAYEAKWGWAFGGTVLVGCLFANTRRLRPYCECRFNNIFDCRIPSGDDKHWLHFRVPAFCALAGVTWHRPPKK